MFPRLARAWSWPSTPIPPANIGHSTSSQGPPPRRRPASSSSSSSPTRSSATSAPGRTMTSMPSLRSARPDLRHPGEIRAPCCGRGIGDVGRRDQHRGAVRGGAPQLDRVVHGARPVVDARQDMAVEVDHASSSDAAWMYSAIVVGTDGSETAVKRCARRPGWPPRSERGSSWSAPTSRCPAAAPRGGSVEPRDEVERASREMAEETPRRGSRSRPTPARATGGRAARRRRGALARI